MHNSRLTIQTYVVKFNRHTIRENGCFNAHADYSFRDPKKIERNY